MYGHWWFEGPQFLDYVLRKMHFDQDTIKCLTPAEYLERYPENQYAEPAGSSWGGDGTYEFWVNETNQDIIPALHQAADRLSERIRSRSAPADFTEPREESILKQMLRELMLAQASDWPFIMRTGTSPDYAKKRVSDHLNRFWILDAMLDGDYNDTTFRAIEQADNIFPECELNWFS
ncbi:MAG: DUF1957 domain-containing protein [Planctomycetes bacterium]|nr:DUF1957 domain-containing protein [Planctomycetota bacterium]